MEFDLGKEMGCDIQGHTADEFFKRISMSELCREEVREVVINFNGVSHIDSMILGTLVSFRNNMERRGKEIILKNPKGDVERKFQLIFFDKIFKII